MSVDLERVDGTAVITINRPEALNAIDIEHAERLHALLVELAEDPAVRSVLLTGAGDKAFVAGADIKYMHGLDVLGARRWGELGHAIGRLLETMPKPTVAAVNGYALGGGCELALACDLRLASTKARIGQPEVNLGIFPGWGGSVRLARATSLGFAKELIFTGRAVEADEAMRRGLVNAVYEPEELLPKALELCASFTAKSPLGLAYAKEATNLALQGSHADNLNTEARLFSMLFSSGDQKEGMAAFVEKREPRFTGS
jgi:enoyl-CoA hydratase